MSTGSVSKPDWACTVVTALPMIRAVAVARAVIVNFMLSSFLASVCLDTRAYQIGRGGKRGPGCQPTHDPVVCAQMSHTRTALAALMVALVFAGGLQARQANAADGDSETELAKKTQNPVADLISVP